MPPAGPDVYASSHRDPASGVPSRRWRIACLLGIGVLVNYLDRVNLSVSHASLVAAFGISNITFGYLSTAYNWTYAMCQLPVGVLLDRFGVRKVGRVSAFLWSVASLLAAISPNIGALFGARLLLGVGEAPTFPANAKATGYWFPPEERGTATAVFDAAAKFASALGVPLLGVILIKAGWRWSFVITGLISFVYFIAFYKLYRDPGEDAELSGTEKRHIAGPVSAEWTPLVTEAEQRAGLGYLLRQRKVLGLALGFGSYNYVFYLLLTWLPSYLASELGIDLLHSFLYTGVPWLFATFTDLLGGWSADQLIRRGYDASNVRKAYLVVGLACGLGIIGAAYSHTATQALVWISISLGGLSAAAPVGWSVPSIIAPRGSVGSVGGIINFSNQLSGIVAPVVTGYVVAFTHSYAWAFWIAAAYLLIGIAGYVFLLGRIEQVDAPQG
ncbi:MAG: MFS transporter [Edaphobacter sp.]|uniref:MFS transporter n=1 Tax=Edaphobacter sp. TaxID=1934404 RepID=UPI0023A17737|nr:MFS transporter [Edaphobacter sp.]MDE1176983.1 MFS transporter [Edaphobacter sp.]